MEQFIDNRRYLTCAKSLLAIPDQIKSYDFSKGILNEHNSAYKTPKNSNKISEDNISVLIKKVLNLKDEIIKQNTVINFY